MSSSLSDELNQRPKNQQFVCVFMQLTNFQNGQIGDLT